MGGYIETTPQGKVQDSYCTQVPN